MAAKAARLSTGKRSTIAWRILDAQHFGVPQRQRRVFLVAGRVGGWANPAEILLKPESLRRHLNRAKKRLKKLPPILEYALARQAEGYGAVAEPLKAPVVMSGEITGSMLARYRSGRGFDLVGGTQVVDVTRQVMRS